MKQLPRRGRAPGSPRHADCYLKTQRVVNPPDTWIRAQNAFEPIVDPATFQAVQQVIEARSRRYSDSELLEALGALLRSHGMLSGLLIDEHETMPSSHAYRTRFGSLVRAYQLVGYTPSRDYEYVAINKALRKLHPDVVSRTIADIQNLGGDVRRDAASDLLVLNDEIRIRREPVQSRQRHHQPRWALLRPVARDRWRELVAAWAVRRNSPSLAARISTSRNPPHSVPSLPAAGSSRRHQSAA